MELEEIIKEIVQTKGLDYNDIITKKDLIPYHYHLINCKYFKDCNVEFFGDDNKLTVACMEPLKQLWCKSIKLSDAPMFTGTVSIENFSLTPPLYDATELNKRPENGAIITPAFYDPKDFVPYKIIKIWFSPETFNGQGQGLGVNTIQTALYSKFNDIMVDPDKYAAPKTYGIIMKGVFKIKYEYDSISSLQIRL
tara:strand:- start:15732 stop:16316 length:585 start_codon:yes stop_codon:yes gene_type:complete